MSGQPEPTSRRRTTWPAAVPLQRAADAARRGADNPPERRWWASYATIPAEEAPRAWYTTEELTPAGECAGGGQHEWKVAGNGTYLMCHKGREHADLHVVDTDGECLNCGTVHWKERAVDHA